MKKTAEYKNIIAVVGLGYVGLPLAVELSKYNEVVGYDLCDDRINELLNMTDKTGESSQTELSNFIDYGGRFTSDISDISNANVYIVTVPTPVHPDARPDFNPLISASKSIGSYLAKNNIVIYESTVFPGATEEICVPVLEQASGLVFRTDFYVGYSPERINPGDRSNNLTSIVKVTSGCCKKSLDIVDGIYSQIITAGTYRAPSIKVAEASKVIENTQRDINIAFMNELSILFGKMNISTKEVLDAASTKWNFLKFTPGLVGGHCISVDPHYLQSSAKRYNSELALVKHARQINDKMPYYIVQELMKNKSVKSGSKVLVKGVTFKEDCPDLRNSKVIDICFELKKGGFLLDIYDPLVDSAEFSNIFDIQLTESITNKLYDVIILAVAHKEFSILPAHAHKENLIDGGLFYDLKSIYSKDETDFQL